MKTSLALLVGSLGLSALTLPALGGGGGGGSIILNCPVPITAECTGGLTPVTYSVTAKDGSGTPLPVTCTPPSGSGFRLGTSNVVCTATDFAGSTASCAFTVTVADRTPPVVACPANITADATSAAGAVVTYVAAASDPCGIASFSCVPPSGSTFPVGTTTVTCTATDGVGNTNACSFTVTVRGGVNLCPTAVAKVSPNVQLLVGQTDTIVIAANGSNACVTLDGTMSSDPDGDALTYVWLVDGSPVAVGAIADTCLELGTHQVRLVVDDGRCSASQPITVDVLTPCEAEGALIIIIQDSGLPRNVQQSLVSSVKAACASFERLGVNSGVNQLQAFKNKVRTHVRPLDLALAYQLEAAAQAIIDALTGP